MSYDALQPVFRSVSRPLRPDPKDKLLVYLEGKYMGLVPPKEFRQEDLGEKRDKVQVRIAARRQAPASSHMLDGRRRSRASRSCCERPRPRARRMTGRRGRWGRWLGGSRRFSDSNHGL